MNRDFENVREGSPHIFIGKNGLTDGQIENIMKLLKNFPILKIKIQKAVIDYVPMDKIMVLLMTKLNVYVMDVRGHVAIITKRSNTPNFHYPQKYWKMKMKILEERRLEREAKVNQ